MGEEEAPEGEELQELAVQLVETGVKLVEKLVKSTVGQVGGLGSLTGAEEKEE